ncbi:hypothetical protein PCE1_000422 [Barthelona sp. PCE]
MSLHSDEVNLLVFRYLLESGYEHSAFTFLHESLLQMSGLHNKPVSPALLISFLQKGIQFLELETHISEDGRMVECDAPFTLTDPHICSLSTHSKSQVTAKVPDAGSQIKVDDLCVMSKTPQSVQNVKFSNSETRKVVSCSEGNKVFIEDVNKCEAGVNIDLPRKEGIIKHEFQEQITDIQWHPTEPLAAVCLKNGDVFKLDLNEDTMDFTMATQSNVGRPVVAKWNPSGTYLCVAGRNTALIDLASWTVKQTFERTGPGKKTVMSLDWQSNIAFATGAKDGNILLHEFGVATPITTFESDKEINCVAFDSSRTLLASGSDDGFACVRNVIDKNKSVMLPHDDMVFTLDWHPAKPWLATGAFRRGAKVRIWDVNSEELLFATPLMSNVLNVKFNETGTLLGAGTKGYAAVWDTRSGKCISSVKTHVPVVDINFTTFEEQQLMSFNSVTPKQWGSLVFPENIPVAGIMGL